MKADEQEATHPSQKTVSFNELYDPILLQQGYRPMTYEENAAADALADKMFQAD